MVYSGAKALIAVHPVRGLKPRRIEFFRKLFSRDRGGENTRLSKDVCGSHPLCVQRMGHRVLLTVESKVL